MAGLTNAARQTQFNARRSEGLDCGRAESDACKLPRSHGQGAVASVTLLGRALARMHAATDYFSGLQQEPLHCLPFSRDISVPNDTLPFVCGRVVVVLGDRTTTSTSAWLPSKGGDRSSQPPQAQTRAAKFSAAVPAQRKMQNKRLLYEVQKQRQLGRGKCRRRYR